MLPDWTARWVLGREVFTAPDGSEWVMTKNPEVAQACIYRFRTPGLAPMYLKRVSADRMLKLAARKARRIERRENARVRRAGFNPATAKVVP